MEINIKDKKEIEIKSGSIIYTNPINTIRYSYSKSDISNNTLIAFYLTFNNSHLIADKINSITVNGIQMTIDNIDVLLSDLFFFEIEIEDVSGLQASLDRKADLVDGLIPSYQLPSYVDDVIEGELVSSTEFDVEGFIITPERGKIYVDITTNLTYRWSGSLFIEISPTPTKESLGLENVDNTSDIDKPVSTAQKNAIDTAVAPKKYANIPVIITDTLCTYSGGVLTFGSKPRIFLQDGSNVLLYNLTTLAIPSGWIYVFLDVNAQEVFTKEELEDKRPFMDENKYLWIGWVHTNLNKYRFPLLLM